MATTAVNFYRGSAPTSNGTLYTVPSAKTAILTDIVISNTNSNQQYVTININGIVLIPNVPISANNIVTFSFKQTISTGLIVSGFASSADVKIHISGVEV
jgi:hypothetical protein